MQNSLFAISNCHSKITTKPKSFLPDPAGLWSSRELTSVAAGCEFFLIPCVLVTEPMSFSSVKCSTELRKLDRLFEPGDEFWTREKLLGAEKHCWISFHLLAHWQIKGVPEKWLFSGVVPLAEITQLYKSFILRSATKKTRPGNLSMFKLAVKVVPHV